MQKTRNLLALVVFVGLMAVWGHVFAAGETTKLSPVLDRILAKKELIVGTAASMPPLNMTTKAGQIIGMEIDLARIFASGMEVKLTLKPMPFNDLLPALEKGQVDMVLPAMTMTPGRNLKFAFVGPYFHSWYSNNKIVNDKLPEIGYITLRFRLPGNSVAYATANFIEDVSRSCGVSLVMCLCMGWICT